MEQRHKASFRLLDLPTELRIRIYELAMPQQIKIQVQRPSLDFKGQASINGHVLEYKKLPLLMLTNHLVYDEVQPIFWRRSVLEVIPTSPWSPPLQENIILSSDTLQVIESIELGVRDWHTVLVSARHVMQNLKYVELEVANADYRYTFNGRAETIVQQLSQYNCLSDAKQTLCEYFKLFLMSLDTDRERDIHSVASFSELLTNYRIKIKLDTRRLSCYTLMRHDDRTGWADYTCYLGITICLNDCRIALTLSDLDNYSTFTHHGGTAATQTPHLMQSLNMADPEGGWDRFESRFSVRTWMLDILLFKLLSERDVLKDFRETLCSNPGECRYCKAT